MTHYNVPAYYLVLRLWMLHVVENTEDNFEDVIPPMRQERITICLQYFKHYSEAPVIDTHSQVSM